MEGCLFYFQTPRVEMRRRIESFGYAFRGIWFAIKTQHNLWIHFLAILAVVIAGYLFKLNPVEWALVVFAIGLVLTAELFNTAVESLVDIISPDYSKKAGFIKDVAAGAVLIAAIVSAIIGCIIFIPKII